MGEVESCRVAGGRPRTPARPHPGSDDGPQPPDFSLESEEEIALVSNLTSPSSFSDFAWHPGGAFY